MQQLFEELSRLNEVTGKIQEMERRIADRRRLIAQLPQNSRSLRLQTDTLTAMEGSLAVLRDLQQVLLDGIRRLEQGR